MENPPSSPATIEPDNTTSQPDNPIRNTDSDHQDPLPVSSTTSTPPPPLPPPPSSSPSTVPANPIPINPPILTSPPPAISSFAPPPMSTGAVVPPTAPSFRPAAPQFSLLQTPQNPAFQNPNAQNPSVQPPGVSPVPVMVPGGVSGAGSATVTPMMHYQVQPGQHPNQAMRPYPMMPNGYPTMPMPGSIPPPVS